MKYVNVVLLGLYLIALSPSAFSYSWGEGEPLPVEGLANPFALDADQLAAANRAGRYHALHYPVTVTGALIPEKPIREMFASSDENPLRELIEDIFRQALPFKSFDQMLAWMGLHKYPEDEGDGAYFVPFSERVEGPDARTDRMGFTLMPRKNVSGFTFSCAACHSADLFGRKIIGLQNRFPRSNQVYVQGDRGLSLLPTQAFKIATGASSGEAAVYDHTRKNMAYVEAKNPLTLGMDTSLAHAALSLSRRKKDEFASKKRFTLPRHERLRHTRADSKPGTWWNVKYKNRWLLDGSVVSGNPIFTNILWNEIGRATDLRELEQWLIENEDTVNELTAAVYASEAPHITDFFPAERIDVGSARRGQALFQKLSCNKCHGNYHKNWDLPGSHAWPLVEQLKTARVEYFEQTPVRNVGTDPLRYQAMSSLTQLNDLRISKLNGARIEVQKGYVPPPLVGIWARWPYLHNNSVPNLCELLTPESKRAKFYWAGPPIDREKDFDFACNGYPSGNRVPTEWQRHKELRYEANVDGRRNIGHSENILVKDGVERLNAAERRDLIKFLQTL